MAYNRHHDKQNTQNQNNLMSDDPEDGSRNSDRVGATEKDKGVPVAPEEETHNHQDTIEAFGEEGAGVAAKE